MEVRGFAVFCALCTLAFGGGGCLLFTEDFNKPPQVTIAGPPDIIYRGETKRFEAMVMDDGEGTPTLDWGVSEGTCPGSVAEAVAMRRASRFFGDQNIFVLAMIPKAGASCVFVVVTDQAGAQSFDAEAIDVKNRTVVIHTPDRIERNKPAAFTAAFVSQPDGKDDPEATKRGTFAWGRDRVCAEAEKTARAVLTPSKGDGVWTLDLAPRRSFCVSVVAKDENGVEATAAVEITEIINTGPAALIRILEPAGTVNPLGLFTTVKLSGADVGDTGPEDAMNYAWTLTRPGGMASKTMGPELSFSTDDAGKYKIELTITEDGKVATATPAELTTEDIPPCIRETEPSFATAPRFVNLYDQMRVFRVTEVTDDADPVPATMRPSLGAFIWSTRIVNSEMPQPFGVRAGNFRELVLPARLYQPGDRVEVRVEYLDRRDLISARDLSHCKPSEPRCELVAGSKCFQRIMWTVDYL